jgi:hypothetical protein
VKVREGRRAGLCGPSGTGGVRVWWAPGDSFRDPFRPTISLSRSSASLPSRPAKCIFTSWRYVVALTVFLMATQGMATGSLSTRWGMCSRTADTMTLPSCTALIAYMYRLRARNFRDRARVKNGAPPREQHSKSGRPKETISATFGSAVLVSKQGVFRHITSDPESPKTAQARPFRVMLGINSHRCHLRGTRMNHSFRIKAGRVRHNRSAASAALQ